MAKHAPIPDELQDQITTSIVRSRRLDDIILKGHLYVEFCLNELILTEWSDKGRQIVERFTFDQKIAIVEGTRLIWDAVVLDGLRGLNKTRNQISHSLFPTGLDELINAIPCKITETPGPGSWTTEYRAKMLVLSLCVHLAGRKNNLTGVDETPMWLRELPRGPKEDLAVEVAGTPDENN